MKTILATAIATAVLLGVPAPASAGVTESEYSKAHTGMTFAQVQKVFHTDRRRPSGPQGEVREVQFNGWDHHLVRAFLQHRDRRWVLVDLWSEDLQVCEQCSG